MRVTRLHHVAIALHDMGPMAALLQDGFGLAEPHREQGAAGGLEIAIYPMGESAVELLQPHGSGSSVPAFFAEKGEGLFHICLEVEDIDAAMVELRAKGLRFRSETPRAGHSGTRVAFLDPATTGGVLFELLEMPAAAAAPHAG